MPIAPTQPFRSGSVLERPYGFWRYRAGDLAQADIDAFTAASEATDPYPTNNSTYHQFLSTKPYRIHLPINYYAVRPHTDGRLYTKMHGGLGNSNDHMMFRPMYVGQAGRWDEQDHVSLVIRRPYEFRFNVYLPSNATNWWTTMPNLGWAILFQVWGAYDPGDTPTNPCFAIALENSDNTEVKWHFRVRGAATEIHSSFDRNTKNTATFAGIDKKYHFRIRYTPDDAAGGPDAVTKVWMAEDGGAWVLVMDETDINAYKDADDVGGFVYMGVYSTWAFNNLSTPGIEAIFDEIQISEVTTP